MRTAGAVIFFLAVLGTVHGVDPFIAAVVLSIVVFSVIAAVAIKAL